MPVGRAVFFACFAALALAGCSGPPMGRDVIAQARSGGQVAFDVVKIDDRVVNTILDQKAPPFHRSVASYQPPPDLKIAVGDVVSVVIWEAGDNGLFGNSLTDIDFPAGSAAKALIGQLSPSQSAQAQMPPGGLTATSPNALSLLLGGPSGPGGGAEAGAALGLAPSGEANENEANQGQQSLGGENGQGARGRQSQPGSLGALLQASGGASPTEAQLLLLGRQSAQAGTRIPNQIVGSDGAISIPYAGRIKVAGRTPKEVEKTIESRLASRALSPQALVVVKRSFANTVSVEGEIIGGKRVPLSPGGDRLLQVIAAAGDLKAPTRDVYVKLSRGNATATVPLATLVADPLEDIFARPGDVLTLERRPQTYTIFGATGINRAITFTGAHMSLEQALAKAGGLRDNLADPSAVFLLRYEPISLVRALGEPIASDAREGVSPVVYRLDMREAKSYLLARRFPVHDKDVIYVAGAESVPIQHVFAAFSRITGPIETGFLVCQNAKC